MKICFKAIEVNKGPGKRDKDIPVIEIHCVILPFFFIQIQD
jgi:hypothetical protein